MKTSNKQLTLSDRIKCRKTPFEIFTFIYAAQSADKLYILKIEKR